MTLFVGVPALVGKKVGVPALAGLSKRLEDRLKPELQRARRDPSE
jgi:hypothetical protein